MNGNERMFERCQHGRRFQFIHDELLIANNVRAIRQYLTLKHFINSRKDSKGFLSKGFLSKNSENGRYVSIGNQMVTSEIRK